MRVLTRFVAPLAALLVLAGLLTACDVRHVDWRNRVYTVTCPGMETKPTTVHLIRGTGSVPVISYGSPAILHVNLWKSITGDVTGDGRAEQVLGFGCSVGGTGWSSEVHVFADGPQLLARLPAPLLVPSAYFHPQYEDFWVSGGRLHAKAEYWAPDDCHFCASIHLSITWRWSGRGFVVAEWHRL